MSKHVLGGIAVALALLAHPVQAQMADLTFRVGAQTTEPTGNLGNAFDYGYGLYARAGTEPTPWSLMGAVTWTRFKGASNAIADVDFITAQFGPHFEFREGFDFGVELAYFTEAEEIGFVPVLSIGLVNIEATLSYNTTFQNPQASWIGLGIGLKF
jgi:hypothetical protein